MNRLAATIAFIAFCASAVRSQNQTATPNCDNPDAKVLILGAGMTGISAAWALQNEGERDFIILEAQDRIGGRMRTESFGGLELNFGAAFIQGVNEGAPKDHPLWKWVEQCSINGFLVDETDPIFPYYGADGTEYPGDSRDPRIEAWEEASSQAAERAGSEPGTLVRTALVEGGWIPQNALDDLIEWVRFDFCNAQPPDKTGLFGLSVYDIGEICYFVNDKRGYLGVLECIANEVLNGNISDPRLHLEAPVTNIQWSDSEECVCATVTEDGGEKKYCAPNAIVTFSLGVLQSQDFQNIVMPPLPQWKLDAINALSFADYLVVFANFATRFWDSKTDALFIYRASDKRGEFVVWENYKNYYNGESNILAFTFTDNVAGKIFSQSKSKTMEDIFTVLQEFYGAEIAEMPLDIAMGDWLTNPYFLGMYSNAPVGTTPETYAMLAAPVGSLYFSGEATSAAYRGFVHGAHLEGMSVANTILNKPNSAIGTGVSGAVFTAAVVVSMATHMV